MKGVGAALPLRLAAALTVLGGASFAILPETTPAVFAFPKPPPLPLAAPGCGTSVEQAPARAGVAELAAASKMARYPFNPEEGVEAARLLSVALACARASRDEPTIERLQDIGGRWADRLEADYRSLQVQVRVALDRDAPAVALGAVRGLRRFLARSTGAYVSWLEREERRLERGGARD